jgi:hypothetical protein
MDVIEKSRTSMQAASTCSIVHSIPIPLPNELLYNSCHEYDMIDMPSSFILEHLLTVYILRKHISMPVFIEY